MSRLRPSSSAAIGVAVLAVSLVLVTSGGVASADPAFGVAHPVNGLASLNADGTAIIDDLSCSSNGNCGAVGTYLDSTRLTQGFVVTETNDVWGSALAIPGLAQLNVGGDVRDVFSISCTATGECTVGGNYTDSSKNRQGFFVSEHDGTWGTATPLTRDPSLPTSLPAEVLTLHCTSPGNCAAGGFFVDGAGTATQSWVASESGGTWGAAVELPGTASLNQGILGSVYSITCPAPGACSAAGTYTDSSNQLQTFVDDQTSGTWGTAHAVPGLVTINSGGVSVPAQISCSAPGRCAVAGVYTLTGGRGEVFVADEVGGVWGSAQEIPGTVNLNTGGSAAVYSIACPGAGSCEAVGSYEDSTSAYQAFVASESGGVWGPAQELPGSAGLNAGGAAGAIDVSCVAAGDCRAVGYYTDASNNYQAFLSTETGGVWGAALEAPGSATLNTEGDAEVDVVSCTSDGACSAGGQYKDSSGYLQAMILDASSAPAPPPTAPGAPSVGAASRAKGQVTVTVVLSTTGGSPVTAYQYSLNAGPWKHGSNGATTFTVGHLKPGARVRLRVRAVNAVGAGSASPSVTVKVR